MRAQGPIFLSASVPVEGRRGFETGEAYLIKEAVSALVEVVLGRRLLVWGGQPAITPMLWEAARQYSVSYENVVRLFQSKYFEGRYPPENTAFPNFKETEVVNDDLGASLLQMRRVMLSSYPFSAAVFVGGMEGVWGEYQLFKEYNPDATVIPIPSPGGVARELYKEERTLPAALEHAIDYSYWLYKLLDVDMLSKRQNSLESD